jgi:hypothetical protein
MAPEPKTVQSGVEATTEPIPAPESPPASTAPESSVPARNDEKLARTDDKHAPQKSLYDSLEREMPGFSSPQLHEIDESSPTGKVRSEKAKIRALEIQWEKHALPLDTSTDTVEETLGSFHQPTLYQARLRRDNVECSVFAPARPARGDSILIQALLHRAEQLFAAIEIATKNDVSANRKGVATLSTKIKRGALIQLFLEIPRLNIEMPFQEVTWRGEPVRVAYSVDIPSTTPLGACLGTLHVIVGGLSVGEVIFELSIGEREKSKPVGFFGPVGARLPQDEDQGADPVAIDAIRFTRAFISYSRKDVSQVLLYAEALDDCGIQLLFDLTSIEPGEEWERQLVDLIDRSDVFYLMWSTNAAMSEWVAKETRIAIDRYDTSSRRVPRIRPVPIEHPMPEPPNYLKRFHFNSKWLALRIAQKHPLFSETPVGADQPRQENAAGHSS